MCSGMRRCAFPDVQEDASVEDRKSRFGAGVLLGVAGTLLVLFVILLAIAYSGGYNIGASTDHASGTRWWLDTLMHASVRSHAPKDRISEHLAAADIAAGAAEYKAMCQHCHGGPGVEAAAWSRGMLPRPPHLQDEAAEWKAGEVFWIVRHGLKYTGMPSFERGHDEATLWNIAAFVALLPAMTPEQYASYEAEARVHQGSGGEAEPQPDPHAGEHEH